MTALTLTTPTRVANSAPIGRLLWSELTWVFKRPRTWIALTLLGLVPVVIAIGTKLSGRRGGGSTIIAEMVGNGFVLPIAALSITLTLLLPLVGAMWSADALAGEASHSTLRYLLVAPVGRVRLLAVKSFGVAIAVLAASTLIAIVGIVVGYLVLGNNQLLTLSGTTLSFGDALLRIAIAVGWVSVQVWAVCAIALAVSACTEHPLVVMAATIAGAIVFGVLLTVPALDFLQPYLLTNAWVSVVDVLRDPMPTAGLLHGLAEAGAYGVIGWSLALARMVTKDG